MIELAEHQRDAVERLRKLLAERGGAILADEVGLGKSHVAAAVAGEHAGEVELIVPAALVAQWQQLLSATHVITHDSLLHDATLPDVSKRRLLIVDEAHAFRNAATKRYAALARRSIGARLLLVTATPICNSAGDLHSLIALIAADDSLQDRGVDSIEEAFCMRDTEAIRRVIEALVIRRERDVLPAELQFGSLERRVIRHPVPPAKGIDELQFPLVGDGTHCALLRRFLWRRLESSEAAFIESLRRQTRFYERALDCLAAGRTLSKRDYSKAFGAAEDREALQQVLFWDCFADGLSADGSRLSGEIEQELTRIGALRREAEASPNKKRSLLLELLANEPEPTLIFTQAAATALDLVAHIDRACGLVTARATKPRDALQRFMSGNLDLLVCTDLASEGLNLQRAGVVIHYDIPWNPVKLDQRNGRAHRIGQQRESVRAIYFLPMNDDTRIIETVAAKNRTRKKLLRGPVTATSQTMLPPHLPRDAPQVALLAALRKRALAACDGITRRHRAGVERLMREMAGEYLDAARVAELCAIIDSEP